MDTFGPSVTHFGLIPLTVMLAAGDRVVLGDGKEALFAVL